MTEVDMNVYELAGTRLQLRNLVKSFITDMSCCCILAYGFVGLVFEYDAKMCRDLLQFKRRIGEYFFDFREETRSVLIVARVHMRAQLMALAEDPRICLLFIQQLGPP